MTDDVSLLAELREMEEGAEQSMLHRISSLLRDDHSGVSPSFLADPLVCSFLQSSLQQEEASIRRSALSVCFWLPQEASVTLATLLPTLLQMSDGHKDTSDVLQCMSALAEDASALVLPHLTPLMEHCIQTIKTTAHRETVPFHALECLTLLCEQANLVSPQMLRDIAACSLLVEECLDGRMQQWMDEDVVQDDYSDYFYDWPYRIARALGCEAFVSTLLPMALESIQSDDWEVRYSALSKLPVCGKVRCKDSHSMHTIIQCLTGSLFDPNPSVRDVGVRALKWMVSDGECAPAMQRFHGSVVPALIDSLSSSPIDRLAAHAAAALVAFLQQSPKEVASVYVGPLRTALMGSLNRRRQRLILEGKSTIMQQFVYCLATLDNEME